MFYRVLWPALISAVALAVADIADALVVGARVGERGLAAIGIVTPVYMIYNLIGYGFSTGGCVTHGKLTSAARNYDALCHFRTLAAWLLGISAVIAVGGNLLMMPLLSMLGVDGSRPELLALCEAYARPMIAAAPVFMLNFILYDFVRCDDGVRLASLGFSLGCAADLALNVVLVLILDMGVLGSVIATVTAQAVSVIVMSIHLFTGRGVLRLKAIVRAVADPKEIRKEVFSSLTIGFSTSIRYVFQFLFLPLGNRLLLRAGDLGIIDGDLYVAVFDVVMNVSYVSSSVFQASSETMQPLASVFSEEHDRDSLKCVLRLALGWGLALGAALAGLLALFAGPVSSFFGVTENASQAVSVPAIRIFCLSAPMGGCLIILMGFYQSVGESKLSSLITLMRSALFLLPIAFVFGMFYPAGFWWLFPACEAASLLLLGMVTHFRRKIVRDADIPVFSAVMDNGDHELQRVMEGIERFCEEQEFPMKKAMQLQLAAEELCLVTLEKAFTGKPEEYIQVTLCEEKNGDFSLRIRNSAPYFNPLDMKMGRLQQDAKEEFLDSIGVMMVKKQAKALYYRNYEGFNVVLAIL